MQHQGKYFVYAITTVSRLTNEEGGMDTSYMNVAEFLDKKCSTPVLSRVLEESPSADNQVPVFAYDGHSAIHSLIVVENTA